MMISTRGRYALRVMVDLAEHRDEGYIPMKVVAERQHISLKYLEKILPALTKQNLIVGVHGKGGGYKLTKNPHEYIVGDILRLTEVNLIPVSCRDCNGIECKYKAECRTKPMWDGLEKVISEYLNGVTVADLMADNVECPDRQTYTE